MLVDVLVLVVLIDGHLHGADLGQDHLTEPGLHDELDPGHRIETEQHLVQFDRHPLDGDPVQLRGHRHDGLPHPLGHAEFELGHEPRGAQHPQRVVAEGDRRLGGGVQNALADCGQPAERVEELPRTLGGDPDRHRVGGEIAAHQVVFEPVPEAHRGVARHLVVAVGPERGDLQAPACLAGPDGAEVDPGVPQGISPRPEDLLDRRGPGVGGEVQVGGQPSEHRVAHAAADQEQLMARRLEQSAHLGQQRSLRVQRDGSPNTQLVLGGGFGHVR